MSGSLGRPGSIPDGFSPGESFYACHSLVCSYAFSSTMKHILILIIMALTILTLNVNGLRDSARHVGNINGTDISSRSKNKSATEAVDHAASDGMQLSCDSHGSQLFRMFLHHGGNVPCRFGAGL